MGWENSLQQPNWSNREGKSIPSRASPQRVLITNLKRSCWCTSFDPLEPTCCRGRCSVRTGHVTHDPKSFSEELSPFFSVRPTPPPEIEFQGRIRGVSVMGSDDWWKNTATRPKKISTGVPSHFIDPELFLLNLSFEVQRLSGHPAGNASL